MTQLILITGLNEQWGIRNEYFVLGDSVILTVLGQVSFMPVLVLAARSCPEVSSMRLPGKSRSDFGSITML